MYMSNPSTTKGFFLNTVVDLVQKKGGESAVSELKKRIGRTKFSGFQDYEVKTLNKVISESSDILYGQEGPEIHFKMGYAFFETYAQTPIGKTLFKLYGGGNIINLAKNVLPIAKTVSKNLEVFPEKVTDHEIIISFKNSAFNVDIIRGLVQAAADIVGLVFTQFEVDKKSATEFRLVMAYNMRNA